MLVVCAGWAQSPDAALVGLVDDPSGARVAGAKITVESLSSGARREAGSNGLGEFRIEGLPPGRYRLTATAPGFRVTSFDVLLSTGVTHTLAVPLMLGGDYVIITTRRGTDHWHGTMAGFFREQDLNARNTLDNPEPAPKQPFTRRNAVASIGGPLIKRKLWFFSNFEYVDEDASVAYSTQ